jgi:Tfp pilus assembly protein PilV
MFLNIHKTNKQGFLLIDVLLAVFILTTVIILGVIIINRGKDIGRIIASETTAVFLIQERAEELRNIRDSNLMAGRSWSNNLTSRTDTIILNEITFTRNTTVVSGADYANITIKIEWLEAGRAHLIETRKRLYR